MKYLRDLELELGMTSESRTRGIHDFNLMSWSLSDLTDLAVRHEFVHDEVLHFTPFGFFQMHLRRMSSPSFCCADDAIVWLKRTIDISRIVHEVAATYLSVKELTLNAHETAVGIYKEVYYDIYYQRLAGVVDCRFKSSWIQYSVGRAICFACFSPKMIDFLVSWQPTDPVEELKRFHPNDRLNKLIGFVSDVSLSDLEERLRECLQRNSNACLSDFDSEAFFYSPALTSEQRTDIENLIFEEAFEWCQALGIETIGWRQFQAAKPQIYEHFCDIATSPLDQPYFFLRRFSVDTPTLRAIRFGQGHFANEVPVPLIRGEVRFSADSSASSAPGRSSEHWFQYYSSTNTRIAFVGAANSIDGEWSAFITQSNESSSLLPLKIACNYSDVSAFLTWRRRFFEAALNSDPPDFGLVTRNTALGAVVVCLQAETVEAVRDEFERMNGMWQQFISPFGGLQVELEPYRLLWYISGDFWRVYDFCTAVYGSVAIGFGGEVQGRSKSAGDGRIHETNLLDGLISSFGLILFKVSQIPGFFVKLYPTRCVAEMNRIFEADRKAGLVRYLESNETMNEAQTVAIHIGLRACVCVHERV